MDDRIRSTTFVTGMCQECETPEREARRFEQEADTMTLFCKRCNKLHPTSEEEAKSRHYEKSATAVWTETAEDRKAAAKDRKATTTPQKVSMEGQIEWGTRPGQDPSRLDIECDYYLWPERRMIFERRELSFNTFFPKTEQDLEERLHYQRVETALHKVRHARHFVVTIVALFRTRYPAWSRFKDEMTELEALEKAIDKLTPSDFPGDGTINEIASRCSQWTEAFERMCNQVGAQNKQVGSALRDISEALMSTEQNNKGTEDEEEQGEDKETDKKMAGKTQAKTQ
jgi:hypothetical protein